MLRSRARPVSRPISHAAGAIDGDQDLTTDEDRPTRSASRSTGRFLGHEDGEPIHYDLHAWLFAANPAGVLAPWNPKVTC